MRVLIGLLALVSGVAHSASFHINSPSPGTISMEWGDLGRQSIVYESHVDSGNSEQHAIYTESGSLTLSRLSGTYQFRLHDCRDTSFPPGSRIECVFPPPVFTIDVEPVCEAYIGNVLEDFNSSHYTVYRGDLDGDNDPADFLLHGKEQFILIHDEIDIPIILEAPTSFKLIKQNDGSYLRGSTEQVCEGSHSNEYDDATVAALVQNGSLSQVSASNLDTANFNNDSHDDFIVRVGSEVSIFHWRDTGTELASQLTISSGYRIVLGDVNGDGRSDIQVFSGSEFIRVYVADNTGRFASTDGGSGSGDHSSRRQTIETTWKLFSDAMKRGDYAESSQYLTANFNSRFSEILDVLGEEAGEVVEQVESIAP